MELFYKILKTAVDGHASDVHLKIGTPVVFRINRELVAIECPFPTEQWMNNVVANIMPALLKKRAEEEAAKIIAQAKAEADQQVVRAREALREQVALLAVKGAEQILRKEVNASVHADLLNRLKAEL